MSVSSELLCSFELLKPLDSSALKSHIKKGRNKRNSVLNSPVSHAVLLAIEPANSWTAGERLSSERLVRLFRDQDRALRHDLEDRSHHKCHDCRYRSFCWFQR